jgi:UDP:flavonoid glycosyltransferase YjiC (YdhE family)
VGRGGNLPPALAVARRLIGRGHTVRGHRAQQGAIEEAGCGFRAFTCAPDADSARPDTSLVDDWSARSPLAVFADLRAHLFFGPAAAFAADVLAELHRRPADAVAVDWMLFGAAAAAEHSGLPAAVLWHSVYASPEVAVPPFGLGFRAPKGTAGRLRDRAARAVLRTMWDKGLPDLNAARAGIGLDPLRSVYGQLDRLDRVLVLSSAAFDLAALAGGALPPGVVYVGPQLTVGTAAPDTGARPRVVAGLSSVYQAQEPLLRRLVGALGRLPVRGLVTTGRAVRLDGAVPGNVEVTEWAAHHDVLPGAALLITHAGHGSVMAGLAHGVPLLCLPMGRDQHDVAARVEHAGAGRTLSPKAGEQAIADAVQQLLTDRRAAVNARRIGWAIKDELAADRAVAELEGLRKR